jgi:hypothetical protein
VLCAIEEHDLHDVNVNPTRNFFQKCHKK